VGTPGGAGGGPGEGGDVCSSSPPAAAVGCVSNLGHFASGSSKVKPTPASSASRALLRLRSSCTKESVVPPGQQKAAAQSSTGSVGV